MQVNPGLLTTKPVARRKSEGVKFIQWMQRVDKVIANRLGVSSSDLPDCNYADWYEDDMSPGEAAREAIQEAGGDI